jgi:hypothetical protein
MRKATVALFLFVITGTAFLAQTVRLTPERQVEQFSFAYSTNGTNSTKIVVTALDLRGNAIPYAKFDFWLADTAGGGVTTVAPVGTDGIVILGSVGSIASGLTTTTVGLQFPLSVIASGAGTVNFGVTNAAKTRWFPVARPNNRVSARSTGTQLATANYGFILLSNFFRDLSAILPRFSLKGAY